VKYDTYILTPHLLKGIVLSMSTQKPVRDSKTEKIRKLYLAIAIGCAAFVVLTFLAMLTYTGGSVDNHAATGYSFTHSFLSNLGMLTALSGKPNWVSAALFFIALAAAGICLVIFFIIFPRLFQSSCTQRVLALIGSILGVLAGICFVGIACAPADIARPAHVQFVIWAFRLFPLAVLVYLPVLFMDKHYPKLYAWVFAVFCLMLIGYYLLMTNGPSFTSPEGLVIQVVGQKVIAYASILSIGIQSIGAYRFLERNQ
jgi:cytochrome bd-type quinol oxidase subunit 2